MSRAPFDAFACSIARSMDVLGDPWATLIVRDVHLGIDTFNELARDLGLSRAVLAERLKSLVAGGILHEQPYQERPVRVRYLLTEAGADLVPVLVALLAWGDRWRSPDGPPLLFTHGDGHPLAAEVLCITCGEPVTAEHLHPVPGPGGRAARGTAVIAERLAGAAAPAPLLAPAPSAPAEPGPAASDPAASDRPESRPAAPHPAEETP